MALKLPDGTLRNLIKKIWVICMTDHPYKINSFEYLYAGADSKPIDRAESLSAVLEKQDGEIISYHAGPLTLNKAVNHRSINGQQRYRTSGLFKSPDRNIYSVSEGCLLGPLGLVYDKKRRTFISQSAKEWTIDLQQSPFTNLVNYPAKIRIDGVTLSLLTNGADGGFYHFLLESVVKIACCQEIVPYANRLMFNGPPTSWKLKWLSYIGIDLAKIIWVGHADHYECEQVVFTNRLIKDQQISRWCIDGLRKLLKVTLPEIAKKRETKIIWITRKGLDFRHLEWENQIFAVFEQVEPVDLASMSCEQTIGMLREATHVIGAHGAGLCNIYLCCPGTKVLELYPNDITFQPCYQRIASLCSLEHAVMYLDFKNSGDLESGLLPFTRIFSSYIC